MSITNPSKATITNRAGYGMLWHANYESQGATTTSIQALARRETMVDPTLKGWVPLCFPLILPGKWTKLAETEMILPN